MILAQDAIERLVVSSLSNARTRGARQSITLAMRAAHRMAALARIRPCVLRNGLPMVSFSFDDVPESAATIGADIMEDFGARGTFFVSTGLLGHRTIDWRITPAEGVRQLAARGHEIALHTHGHRPLVEMTRRDFASDFRACVAAMDVLAPARSANFAYPFGFGHLAHARLLKRSARSSRTTHPGINVGRADLHFLKSWAFGSALHDKRTVDRLLDRTVACGGWLIFTGHDVAERRSPYGCTPGLLAHALQGARVRSMMVATIDFALDLCGVDRFSPSAPGPRP